MPVIEPSSVSEISSRRFACDRCRGQKLRCLREGVDQERCDRCCRANVDCITSPAFRTKRPRLDATATSRTESGRRPRPNSRAPRGCANPQSIRESTLGGSETTEKRRVNQSLLDEDDLSTLLTQPDNLFTERSSLDNSTWLESPQGWQTGYQSANAAKYVAFRIAQSSSDVISDGNSALSWGENDNSAMYGLIFVDDVNTSLMNLGGLNDLPEKSGHQEIASMPTPTSPPIPISTKPTLSSRTIPGLQGVGDNSASHRELESPDTDVSRPSLGRESEGDIRPHQGLGQTCRPKSRDKDSCIQRLSNLSLDLSTQLSRIDAGPPTVTLDVLLSTSNDDEASKVSLIDKILNSTREFLDILIALTTSSRLATASPSVTLYSSLPHSTGDREKGGRRSHMVNSVCTRSSSVYSSLDSLPTSPASEMSASNKRSSGDDIHLDGAALLLLTTCYVYSIRLYVVLFALVQVFLTEIAASDDPYLCPIPEISFSAFPLRKSIFFVC